jgi:transcription elongation factor GreA
MKKVFKITAKGKRELEDELATLKASRLEIAEKIATARDFGDLSENAEYDAARTEQNVTESRINEIEEILENAEIIARRARDKVTLGSEVTLGYGKKRQVYSLVGPVEANPLESKISNESPLGKALLGKKTNDTAEIDTPKGKITYRILAIN